MQNSSLCYKVKKCKLVKNPCKICCRTVSTKNGLKCEGACQGWVHYNCLNYTPGRIRDIQQGIIHVSCPCPECESSFPKEFRTDQPFSCTNQKCPANRHCANEDCPSNLEMCNQTSRNNSYPSLLKCEKKQCVVNIIPNSVSSSSIGPSFAINTYAGDGRRSPQQGMQGGNEVLPAVQQICDAVGQLTSQLTSIMSQLQKLANVANESSAGRNLRVSPRQSYQANCAPAYGPKKFGETGRGNKDPTMECCCKHHK